MTDFDDDAFKWSKEQEYFIRNKEWDKVDHRYVASVVSVHGYNDHYRLEGLIILWMQSMLKIDYYPEFTDEIEKWTSLAKKCVSLMHTILKHSPSLFQEVEESLHELYINAQTTILVEIEDSLFSRERFTEDCPWTLDEILNNKGEQ